MIEMKFKLFHLVLFYVLNNLTSVFSWELIDASKKLGKIWTEDLGGQDICAEKYTYKERYYVCFEATKILKRKAPLLSRLQLGADSELRRIRCRERRVFFSYKRNGTYGSASRLLYECPVADPDSNIYLFGQGKNRNEIGIYNKVQKERGSEVWFYGVMRDIDLDTFGKRLYRKNIKLIHYQP